MIYQYFTLPIATAYDCCFWAAAGAVAFRDAVPGVAATGADAGDLLWKNIGIDDAKKGCDDFVVWLISVRADSVVCFYLVL